MLNIDMIGWGGRPEGNVIDLETAREFNAYAQVQTPSPPLLVFLSFCSRVSLLDLGSGS
jgi:hypothetical protein